MNVTVTVASSYIILESMDAEDFNVPTYFRPSKLLNLKPLRLARSIETLAFGSANQQLKGVELYFPYNNRLHWIRLTKPQLNQLEKGIEVETLLR